MWRFVFTVCYLHEMWLLKVNRLSCYQTQTLYIRHIPYSATSIPCMHPAVYLQTTTTSILFQKRLPFDRNSYGYYFLCVLYDGDDNDTAPYMLQAIV